MERHHHSWAHITKIRRRYENAPPTAALSFSCCRPQSVRICFSFHVYTNHVARFICSVIGLELIHMRPMGGLHWPKRNGCHFPNGPMALKHPSNHSFEAHRLLPGVISTRLLSLWPAPLSSDRFRLIIGPQDLPTTMTGTDHTEGGDWFHHREGGTIELAPERI